MTASHSGAVFNHSCLKVPLNPSNKLPNPSYERKYVRDSADNLGRRKKAINFQQELSGEDLVSADASRKVNSVNIVGTSEDVVDSFVDFYSSIPDYRELNHLSDREFSIKVQDLREKQRSYLSALDKKSFNDMRVTLPSKIKHIQNKKALVSSPTSTGGNASFTMYVTRKDDESYNKKHDLKKSGLNLPVSYSGKNYSTGAFKNELYPEDHKPRECTKSLLSDTISTASVDKDSEKGKIVPSIHVNNYISDDDCGRSDLNTSSKISMVSQKTESPAPYVEPFKAKVRKPTNGTNKVRDIHSASTAKPGSATVDSSSSVVDSMWDGFSVDEYFAKSRCKSSSGSDSGSDDRLPFAKSLPSSPVCRPSKNVAWKDPNITVPEPFEMTLRDEEEHYMHYLLSLEEPFIEKEQPKHFRANPVPLTSRVPLYDQIVAKQENRRRRVRKQCMAKLLSQMKPFSFVDRDKKSRLQRLCCSTPDLRDLHQDLPKPFRARPVPKNLFSSYVYERMREDEFYRDLKRRIRAEELLKASALPPSMAAREKLAKTRALSSDMLSEHVEAPRRRHRIPNYKKSHRALMRELRNKYDDNITTSPQPFHLETASRSARKVARFASPDSSSNSSPYEARSSPVSRRPRPQSALGLPLNRNNLAAVLRIQSARRRLEQEVARQQEELQAWEEARARSRLMRRNPVWQALAPSMEEDLAMRMHMRRQEESLRREEHQHFMEHMLERVWCSPTLFERQTVKKQKAKGRVSRHVPDSPDLYDEPEASHSETSAGRSSKSTVYVPSDRMTWTGDHAGRQATANDKGYTATGVVATEPDSSQPADQGGQVSENSEGDGGEQ